jgi:NADPH2:quinone reductase
MTLIGLQSSDYREREPETFQEAQKALLDLYSRGRISVHITRTYPLEEAAEALKTIRSGQVRGKVVLTTEAL